MMKPRTKSTRDTATSDLKGRKPSEGRLNEAKHRKKEELGETRRNLIRTLTLLGHTADKKASLSQLSYLIHEQIKSKVTKQNSSMDKIAVEKVVVNASCELQKGRRRSNSTLDEYFKDKFGSPPKDEEEVEKKLRVLKALKNSQELVAKNSMRGFQNSWVHSVCDLHDNNIVLEKIKSRMTK